MMKTANLDTLTGYAAEKSMPVKQRETGPNVLDGVRRGFNVLREPIWNKGKFNSSSDETVLRKWRRNVFGYIY